MKNILLIEDNETIIMGLEYLLKQEGFGIEIAKNVKEAKECLKVNSKIDLILLDISLPDGDGFQTCKEIKEESDIPVIFLTARDEETDVVSGLDMGADDYIVKPFRARELVSRIRNVLRRYKKNQDNANIIMCKNIKIDTDIGKVYKDNKEIVFTGLEYKILLMLFNNKNKLITREELLDKIWDIAGNFVNDNTLTVYIKRIREKIEDKDNKIIQTVRGIGYRVDN